MSVDDVEPPALHGHVQREAEELRPAHEIGEPGRAKAACSLVGQHAEAPHCHTFDDFQAGQASSESRRDELDPYAAAHESTREAKGLQLGARQEGDHELRDHEHRQFARCAGCHEYRLYSRWAFQSRPPAGAAPRKGAAVGAFLSHARHCSLARKEAALANGGGAAGIPSVLHVGV